MAAPMLSFREDSSGKHSSVRIGVSESGIPPSINIISFFHCLQSLIPISNGFRQSEIFRYGRRNANDMCGNYANSFGMTIVTAAIRHHHRVKEKTGPTEPFKSEVDLGINHRSEIQADSNFITFDGHLYTAIISRRKRRSYPLTTIPLGHFHRPPSP